MYNWVVRRIAERTQGPQPVFTTIIDQTVRTWIPATVLLASCFVTPAQKKLDVRTYDWAPQPAWVFTSLTPTATTAQLWPAIEASTQRSYRTSARAQFDVRYTDWEWDAPYGAAVDASVRTWTGVFSAQKASERTRGAVPLDVRTYDWAPQTAWYLFGISPPATTAQTWPAVLQNLPLSYRTGERARLDVRGYEWTPQFGWVSPVVDGVVASWSPALWSQRRSGDIPLSPRAASIATGPDLGWLTSAVSPSATTAETFPALQQALASFRTADAPRLDIRRQEWLQAGWVVRAVDSVVAKWLPIWDAEFGYRTVDKSVLDVRTITSDPELAWLAAVLTFTASPSPTPDYVVSVPADDLVVLIPVDSVSVTT